MNRRCVPPRGVAHEFSAPAPIRDSNSAAVESCDFTRETSGVKRCPPIPEAAVRKHGYHDVANAAAASPIKPEPSMFRQFHTTKPKEFVQAFVDVFLSMNQ